MNRGKIGFAIDFFIWFRDYPIIKYPSMPQTTT